MASLLILLDFRRVVTKGIMFLIPPLYHGSKESQETQVTRKQDSNEDGVGLLEKGGLPRQPLPLSCTQGYELNQDQGRSDYL